VDRPIPGFSHQGHGRRCSFVLSLFYCPPVLSCLCPSFDSLGPCPCCSPAGVPLSLGFLRLRETADRDPMMARLLGLLAAPTAPRIAVGANCVCPPPVLIRPGKNFPGVFGPLPRPASIPVLFFFVQPPPPAGGAHGPSLARRRETRVAVAPVRAAFAPARCHATGPHITATVMLGTAVCYWQMTPWTAPPASDPIASQDAAVAVFPFPRPWTHCPFHGLPVGIFLLATALPQGRLATFGGPLHPCPAWTAHSGQPRLELCSGSSVSVCGSPIPRVPAPQDWDRAFSPFPARAMGPSPGSGLVCCGSAATPIRCRHTRLFLKINTHPGPGVVSRAHAPGPLPLVI